MQQLTYVAGLMNVKTEQRIQFINHNGKRILLVDCSNCSARETEEIVRRVPDFVTVLPRASVLLLANFTEASVDAETVRAMKESAVFDKEFVRKSAWIGTVSLPADLKRQLETFSHRKFSTFESLTEALSWLTSD